MFFKRCCNNPDIEIIKVSEYDLIGRYIKKVYSDKVKCCFSSFCFSYDGDEYYYKYDVLYFLKKRVCLNCHTCNTKEIDKCLKEFDEWLLEEQEKKQRQRKVEEICRNGF